MYYNYGNRDFFSNGMLVERGDNTDNLILCEPNGDDTYRFASIHVDWTADWIDVNELDDRLGHVLDLPFFDSMEAVIECTKMYPWDRFGIDYDGDWQHMTRDQIYAELGKYKIAWEELNIPAPVNAKFDVRTIMYETSSVGARRMSDYGFMRFVSGCMDRFKAGDWGIADKDQIESNDNDPMNALGIYCFDDNKADQLWIKSEDKGYGRREVTAMFPLEY